jgi:tetrahydromethanopterin S-methyltransferase subunit E
MTMVATHLELTQPDLLALAPARHRWRVAASLALTAGAVAAWSAGAPEALHRADPELATLLQGMAALKALVVAPVLAALWWRLGRSISAALAAAYVLCAAAMVVATVLIARLTWLPLAAIAFHVAMVGFAVLALKDEMGKAAAMAGRRRR